MIPCRHIRAYFVAFFFFFFFMCYIIDDILNFSSSAPSSGFGDTRPRQCLIFLDDINWFVISRIWLRYEEHD